MKIIAFGVREDELPYFEQYAGEFSIEYATTSKELTGETAQLAKGFDAVSIYTATSETNEAWAVLESLGIEYVTVRTAGFDAVDVDRARNHRIKVANVPQYSPSAIAEFTVAMTLAVLRKIPLALRRARVQDFSVESLLGRELNEMTVGVIGTGRIGLTTAKVFNAFGAKVIGHDLHQNDEAREVLEYKSLDEIFAEADVISLHIPLTAENKHLINRDSIAKMKDGVVIINTARGAHIDGEALRDALISGKVSAAGLDVYEYEESLLKQDLSGEIIHDAIYRDLANLPNVIMTPHIAFNTDKAVRNMVKMSTENLISFQNAGVSDNEITKIDK